jgi:hypothetical protein
MSPPLRIGLDFDNTLVCYDRIFFNEALKRGWIFGPSSTQKNWGKNQIREQVRGLFEGEVKWQTLQAEVYGPRMGEAVLMAGVGTFLQEAVAQKAELFIVSHKTQFARQDNKQSIDLRLRALAFMETHGFFAKNPMGLSPETVFFADTREQKVSIISQLGCDVFIDDLPEVFAQAAFPSTTKKILINPKGDGPTNGSYLSFRDWASIQSELFE